MPRWEGDLLDRVATKFEVTDDGCWIWIAARNKNGYGMIRDADKRYNCAHRIVYEAVVEPIAEGLELDHLCRNRRCVNPDHLEPVTHAENVQRGSAVKAACPKGHPYDREWDSRRCSICRAESKRRSDDKRRAQGWTRTARGWV